MDDSRTLWCGNLSDKVTEELLYELFLQAAPLERVKIPTDKEGRKLNYAFITFKHEISVDYTLQLLNGICLFGKNINLKRRNANNQNNERNMAERLDLRNYIQMASGNDMRYGQSVNPDNRPRRFDRNTYDREDRYREYRKPDNRNNYDHNRHDSPNRRNNYNEQRHNFDRNNRRNPRHY